VPLYRTAGTASENCMLPYAKERKTLNEPEHHSHQLVLKKTPMPFVYKIFGSTLL
jgi:hypothetical protein